MTDPGNLTDLDEQYEVREQKLVQVAWFGVFVLSTYILGSMAIMSIGSTLKEVG